MSFIEVWLSILLYVQVSAVKRKGTSDIKRQPKNFIAPESDPCKWVAVAHYQLCDDRKPWFIWSESEALTYYLACSRSLSLSVLLFELVLRFLNHLKITRRPSNYWKWVQSGASMSATVFSLNNTLTKMHQCSICRGNKRFSKKKIVALIFVHAVLIKETFYMCARISYGDMQRM